MLGFGRAFLLFRYYFFTLIIQVDLQLSLKRINGQFTTIQIRLVHVDGVDVGIFVGGVVVDSLFLVHARGINGVFVLAWGYFT